MKKLKLNSGITLIALIITIIILLILAGISISMITGENGIAKKAQSAKEKTNVAEVREKVELAVQGAFISGLGVIEEENLVQELDSILGDDKYEISDDTNGWIITVGTSSVQIFEDGTILVDKGESEDEELPQENWPIVWTNTGGTWSEKLEDGEYLEADIIVRIYKTDELITPVSGDVTYEEYYATKMVVEGNGEMGTKMPPWLSATDSKGRMYRNYITEVVVEDGVTDLGFASFANFISLTNVDLNDNITAITNMAFLGCSSLTDISNIIDGNVTTIGSAAFQSCTSLKNLTIPKNITQVLSVPFSLSGLTTLVIEEGVTEIGESSFSSCEELTSVTIPSTVKKIGDMAFYGCYKLNDVILQEGLTTIGMNAFFKCDSLETIVIPSTVTFIDEYAFFRCKSLSQVYFKQLSTPTFGDSCFYKDDECVKTTFYFKKSSIANAFNIKNNCVIESLVAKSTNYNW